MTPIIAIDFLLPLIIQNQYLPNSFEYYIFTELLRWIDSSPELTVPILVKNARIVPNHLESKCEVTQKMCEYALTYCSLNDEETVSAILWTLCHNVKMISGIFFLFLFCNRGILESVCSGKKGGVLKSGTISEAKKNS